MSTLFTHNRNGIVGNDFSLSLDPRGGLTVAIEAPHTEVIKQIQVGESFDQKVGIAKCSTEDNYNKKIGRELAVSRMKSTNLKCVEVQDEPNGDRLVALSDGNNNALLFKRLAAGKVFFLRTVKEIR